ncbi:Short-chain dehydrogenase [Chitinophaga sp. CF118]|uniref:SDR family NAD(P)-dependent oxidoreductase n=1 Tax=Chitinophaga sp. CF118 TaxID=1884367 RepID=UPI0008F2954F|nr:SDR family NAD(P)-dependent oxidoreductase [Chitinophaga sp. CF118]SFD76898.1 Short-chain dehydrogenase [Chitinophaga sp. CF118]
MTNKKIVVITGVGRKEGIGYETAKQLSLGGFHVIITARNFEKANQHAKELQQQGLDVTPLEMDVTSDESISAAATVLKADYGKIDVLINNAAIMFFDPSVTTNKDLNSVTNEFNTNVVGVWRVCQQLIPLIKNSGRGKIINISSTMGSFTAEGWGILDFAKGPVPSYSLTKLAVNGLTIKMAKELKDDHIQVNALCPGFTATYPGTSEMGARPVEESVKGIIWAVTLPDNGPTGKFFNDMQEVPW